MQYWRFRVAKDIVLNQVRVYHERVYADNVVSKYWLVRSFSSQHYCKYITNLTSKNVSQVRTNECKTRSFICKVTVNILGFSRDFNCDTNSAAIVSFFNESVHGFNDIRNGRAMTRSKIVEF